MSFFWYVLLAAPFVLLLWLVIDGLQNGVVRMQGGTFSRAEEPVWFWGMIALYAVTIGVCAYLVIPMFNAT